MTEADHASSSPASAAHDDPECARIANEEDHCLNRVVEHVEAKRIASVDKQRSAFSDYDAQLLILRDELSGARQEDMPPLLEQMERLQSLADQRRKEQSQGQVDLRSPYFGRLVLEEKGKQREVLIGRGTYLDTKSGIRIVDWRDAPVSRLYYRYQEGDDYSEVFGDREVEGEVITRRSVTITDGSLRRITCPQGSFARTAQATWRRLDPGSTQLSGGEGSAYRAGNLGIGGDSTSEEKTLKEITALIDGRQFELITRSESGLVVIQGGAGSGKTTIGLHRLAYLAFQDTRRFRPDKMLVVVFNDALCRYIAQVLPALGVDGVAIRTYVDWAEKLRRLHLMGLPSSYSTDAPVQVTRLKKHPVMLRVIDEYVADLAVRLEDELRAAIERSGREDQAERLLTEWESTKTRPLRHRAHHLGVVAERFGRELGTDLRVAVERISTQGTKLARDVVSAWSELLTDRSRIEAAFAAYAPGAISSQDLSRALDWCAAACHRVTSDMEARRDGVHTGEADDPADSKRGRSEDSEEDTSSDDHSQGIDGARVDDHATLDREDDTLLLRLHQRMRGPLLRGSKVKEALVYEHMLIDEAQDYSPVELAVLFDTVSAGRSITLAGDTAQRLHMDNGFTDWNGVLSELNLSHVEVEPLKLSYRSTQEIIDLAHSVLGHLAPEDRGIAVRHGAPVELFRFGHSGDAAGFLAEQLRALMLSEPRASVAVVARFPEQADAYHEALVKGEVPRLRRIADQDFPFRPGVDVTDIRQVKGLEFDYVILVEVTAPTYPQSDDARHLLHIGSTRAAHQLWILTTGEPSRLLPAELLERAL